MKKNYLVSGSRFDEIEPSNFTTETAPLFEHTTYVTTSGNLLYEKQEKQDKNILPQLEEAVAEEEWAKYKAYFETIR